MAFNVKRAIIIDGPFAFSGLCLEGCCLRGYDLFSQNRTIGLESDDQVDGSGLLIFLCAIVSGVLANGGRL